MVVVGSALRVGVTLFLVLLLITIISCEFCDAFVVVNKFPPQQQFGRIIINAQQQHTRRGTTTSTRRRRRRSTTFLFYSEKDSTARDALERTAAHLDRLKQLERMSSAGAGGGSSTRRRRSNGLGDNDDDNEDEEDPRYASIYQGYIRQSANSLKEQLKDLQLPRNGRKPDLARRLAQHELQRLDGGGDYDDLDADDLVKQADDLLTLGATDGDGEESSVRQSFNNKDAFSPLLGQETISDAAHDALRKANFLDSPSPIQKDAIPALVKGESVILHAATGSGKTLAYLLPLTERLWQEKGIRGSNAADAPPLLLIVTPTRELAAQVAGIATVLAPPGSVRFVSRPTHLLSTTARDQGEIDKYGGRRDDDTNGKMPRLYIGSAKAIQHSLYGDGGHKMPASPTPKPLAMDFLRRCQVCVLDEVDRLLNVAKTKADKKVRARRSRDPKKTTHERPAAILTAAILRLHDIQAPPVQVVAASATVGRPLKRELARVMGLSPQDCPRIIMAAAEESEDVDDMAAAPSDNNIINDAAHSRAVTIPDSVQNYLVPVQDGTSDGKLLTAVGSVIHALHGTKNRRILLVLSRGGFEMTTRNVIGALQHFQCKPEPISLLDALEADGTDRMMQVHRQVSKSAGVGAAADMEAGSSSSTSSSENDADDEGYLLVTGEDTIRGLHLDGLDVVISVGRPQGPDEYTHIAGRTGRQGKPGIVLNIVSDQKAATMKSWQRMLNVDFKTLAIEDISQL